MKKNLFLYFNRSSKVIFDEDNREIICEYFSLLINIGYNMENFTYKLNNLLDLNEQYLRDFNFYEKMISQTFGKPLKEAVAFHFLTERKTNRIDRPEWLFSFIQNLLEINFNAFLELGVKSNIYKLYIF